MKYSIFISFGKKRNFKIVIEIFKNRINNYSPLLC